MIEPEIVAWRLSWKPGDFIFLTLEQYELETTKASADIWALYREPHPQGSKEIAVYRGPHWVQPKYVYPHTKLDGFIPLYSGPLLYMAPICEDVAFKFPGLMDERLKMTYPELFRKEVSDGRRTSRT
jgi:hypothetical protein